MPRTQHLSNIDANRIYALDGQLLYKHHSPKITTAIIEQDNTQSKIKIPNSYAEAIKNHEFIEGSNYHFAMCYISPSGWIHVRNPENTITENKTQAIEEEPNVRLFNLPELVDLSERLNGHYLNTLLYVIDVKSVQSIKKGRKQLNLCILKCFSEQYLIDVSIWNYDLEIERLVGERIVFSGFRLKKIADHKFILVSSVYSKIAKYEGMLKTQPYSPQKQYFNVSTAYEKMTLEQMNDKLSSKDKIFSEVSTQIIKIDGFTYQGCSSCKRKLLSNEKCFCDANSAQILYKVMKICLGDESMRIWASIFDQNIQNALSEIRRPIKIQACIKSSKKQTGVQSYQISHIVSKLTIL